MVKKREKLTAVSLQNNALVVRKRDDENEKIATARTILESNFRHAVTIAQVLKTTFGSTDLEPGFGDYADAIREKAASAAKGDLAFVSEILAAQVLTLDTIFGEMARRMAVNAGDYPSAAETYGRMAMKAQAQARATSEALAKLHQPREQTVRHVHVNEGGQAIVADEFHQHAGGSENAKSVKQCQATGKPFTSAALPSANAEGNGVPIPSGKRQKAMQDARRY